MPHLVPNPYRRRNYVYAMIAPMESQRTQVDAARWAWAAWAIVAVAWLATRVALWSEQGHAALLWQLALLVYGAVGALIVSKRPGNAVGWLFFSIGMFDVLSGIFRSVAHIRSLGPGITDAAAWVQVWIWGPSMVSLVLLMYVFPVGSLPPGRWRWGPRVALVGTVTLLGPAPFLLWPHRGPTMLGDRPAPGIAGLLPSLFFLVLAVTFVAGVVFMALRLRRSHGRERQQLKWFVYAGSVLIAGILVDSLLIRGPLDMADSWTSEVVSGASLLMVPASAVIAITRHRLYDIDRIINRTFVYTAVTGTLAAFYFGTVTIIRALAAGVVGEGALPVAVSTLGVAAMFQPVRRRIQGSVDRHFNRGRYDATLTVGRFSTRLRDEIELNVLEAELLHAVRATMQPRGSSLWLSPTVSRGGGADGIRTADGRPVSPAGHRG